MPGVVAHRPMMHLHVRHPVDRHAAKGGGRERVDILAAIGQQTGGQRADRDGRPQVGGVRGVGGL
jgi:hypothetical protein